MLEIESAFVSMVKERADALIINNNGFTILHRKRLAAVAIAKKLPTICEQVLRHVVAVEERTCGAFANCEVDVLW